MAQGLLGRSCFKYLNIIKKLPYLILRSGKFGILVTSFFFGFFKLEVIALFNISNNVFLDDIISKYTSSKKRSERRAILFDGILILCKHQTSSYMHHNHNNYSYREYRLKERLHMRKVEIRDLPDNDEIKFAFEIVPRNEPSIILIANSLNSKLDWLANLVMLNTKPMFDRILDSILLNLENQNPLKLPSVHLYRFAEPDSKTNIVFEHREASDGVPLIKGATLLKLVERLTFHLYADMTFMRTFLTTYRYVSFHDNIKSRPFWKIKLEAELESRNSESSLLFCIYYKVSDFVMER